MSVINKLPENSNVNVRICDERWTLPFIGYENGYESMGVFLRTFSAHALYDIDTMNNLVSLGYDPADPFVMDGMVIEDEVDSRIESIRRGLDEFKLKLNDTFNQTREEFISNPQFFNFQNFIAENRFSIAYAEKLMDVRNNVIYRGDKLKEAANKTLMNQTLFGSTPSNYGEARLMWQNLFFWPYDNDITKKEGLQYLTDFFSSRNIRRRFALGTFRDPFTVRTSDGVQYYNNNHSVRPFNISVRRHIKLPATDASSLPIIGWDEGIILSTFNPSSAMDDSPFLNLTPDKITVRGIASPPINPMTYRRYGVSHKTMISRNRRSRSPEIGYGKGGSTEIQGRTPLVSSIGKPSTVVVKATNEVKTPLPNNDFNIFIIGGSRTRSVLA